ILAHGFYLLDCVAQASLRSRKFLLQGDSIAFNLSRDLVQIGFGKCGSRIRDNELTLKPAQPDAALLQGSLAQLALTVQNTQTRGSYLTPETLLFSLPREARRGDGVLRSFKPLVKLTDFLLSLVQVVSVL